MSLHYKTVIIISSMSLAAISMISMLLRRKYRPKIRRLTKSETLAERIEAACNLDNVSLKSLKSETCSESSVQQFGILGMHSLEKAIEFWENAQDTFLHTASEKHLCLTSAEDDVMIRRLNTILKEANVLMESCEMLFLDRDAPLAQKLMDSHSGILGSECSKARSCRSLSSVESFYSCSEDSDDDLSDCLDHSFLLYHDALSILKKSDIPYRTMLTESVGLTDDSEYLAKVHCLRLGTSYLLSNKDNQEWYFAAGRQIVSDLLFMLERDPNGALEAYDLLIQFVSNPYNIEDIRAELLDYGIRVVSFYDVVIDFILMDSFRDLENPPSKIVMILQNKWATSSFKQSCLNVAIGSMIRFKRSCLRKYPSGFMNFFYNLMDHLTPAMVWGFLGPDENLRKRCQAFRVVVLNFLHQVFDFSKVRYTTVEELSVDIFYLSREAYKDVLESIGINF